MSSQQNKELALLHICAKQYVYACKSMEKSPNFNEFSSKIKLHWKVEKCTWRPLTWLETPSLYNFISVS